jgi:hypothetical protein
MKLTLSSDPLPQFRSKLHLLFVRLNKVNVDIEAASYAIINWRSKFRVGFAPLLCRWV